MAIPKKVEKKGHGMAPDLPNIFLAAAHDDVPALDVALQHIDVNVQDENLMTPLHHAAVNVSMRAIDRLLAESGIDATIVDKFDRNASHAALEVLGSQGMIVAEKLRPYCYPEQFQEIESRLAAKLE